MSPYNDDPTLDSLCNNLLSAILKTIADDVVYTRKKNSDWFDENDNEIQNKLTGNRATHHGHMMMMMIT